MATTKDFIVKNGVLVLGVGSVASSNTTTGALVVQGGAGIGGTLNIGGKAFVLDTTNATNKFSGALQVAGGAGFDGNIYADNIYSNGAAAITTATLTSQPGIVYTIAAGTDTVVSSSTGNVTIWNASTLQSVTNRGASTTNALTISNATASTSSSSGALVVTGGVGIGGDLWVGGVLHASVSGSSGQADNLNGGAQYDIPFQTALSTTGFDTGLFQYNNTDKTLKVDNLTIYGESGVLGSMSSYSIAAKDNYSVELYSTNTYGASTLNWFNTNYVSARNNGVFISAGGEDAYSLYLDSITGNLTYQGGIFQAPYVNPTNLTSNRVPYYNGSYLVDSSSLAFDGSKLTVPALDATGQVHITNTSTSNTSTNGALVVDGGVGIGGSLNLAGDLNVWGSTVFGQPVTFNGGATYVLSTNTVYTDNILELHVPPGGTGATWGPEGASQDIGLRFHYYNRTLSTDSNAAFVLAADSQTFEFYNTGAESNTGTFVGANYGDIKAGAATFVSTTNATNTQSGALIVTGGAGIGNDLYVGGTAYVNGSQVVTLATLGSASVVNSITAGTGIIVSASTGNITVSNSGVVSLAGSTYLGVSASTGSVTLTNLGVQTLTAGTDTVVSSSTGTITVWDKSTFQSVTSRGATSDQIIRLTNATASTSTTSGALIVTGGVGVGENLYVTGNIIGTNVTQITGNQGQFFGDVNGFTALYAGLASYTALPSTVLQTTANINDYAQNNFQNNNTGTTASTDWVATAGDGNDTTNFIDFGITTAAWDGTQVNSLGTALGGNDAYLYVQGGTGGGNLVLGAASAGKQVKIVAGGSGSAAIVAVFDAPNTASTSSTSGALTIAGGVGVSGDLYAGTVYSNNKQAITDVAPVAGTAITISNVSTASGQVTFTVNNNGVTSLTAGTDTAISGTTGAITLWDTSTLDSVLGRGNSSSSTLSITNASASTSSVAGNALTVTGGIGANTIYASNNIYVNGSPVVTEADIAGLGVTSITGGAGIGVNTSTGAITVTNLGVRTLTAGTGTVVSSTTGTVTVWSSDTLQNVTDRGNSTSNAVNINNSTESTDTSSGALQVTGGAAVGKNLNVGGTANIGPAGQILSYTSASTGTSATLSLDSFNIADYQTAKYLVQIVDTGFTPVRIQVEELMVFHDDNGSSTNAYIVRYGLGYNSQELGDFDATYSAGKVTLQFVPGYTPSALTVKTLRTAITTTV